IRPRSRFRGAHLVKQCAPMFGGSNRSWSSSDCRFLLSIRRGLRFKVRIILSATTFRRFIHRKFSVTRRTVGLVPSRHGGRAGLCFHQRYWCFGPPAAFGSLVITIAVPTTSRFGQIRQHAPLGNPERHISASVRFLSSCKTHTAIFSISRSSFSSSSRSMFGRHSGLSMRPTGKVHLVSASVRSYSPSMLFCSLAIPLVVIPCGIWPGDFSISFQNHEIVTAPTHA